MVNPSRRLITLLAIWFICLGLVTYWIGFNTGAWAETKAFPQKLLFMGQDWQLTQTRENEQLRLAVYTPKGTNPVAAGEMMMMVIRPSCVNFRGPRALERTKTIMIRLHPADIQGVTRQPLAWKTLEETSLSFIGQWQVTTKNPMFFQPEWRGMTLGQIKHNNCHYWDYVTERKNWTPERRKQVLQSFKRLRK